MADRKTGSPRLGHSAQRPARPGDQRLARHLRPASPPGHQADRRVHPIRPSPLQAYCAKCHDGAVQGQFQLVPIKSRADRTPDALRANLDATLRLIDPENPSHSVLLSSTLRPHGSGAKPRPIFSGSNDRAYKVLADGPIN